MIVRWNSKRELYAGCLTSLVGLVAVIQGSLLGVGSLTQMGAGYLPLTVGLILIVLGATMSISIGRDAEAIPQLIKPEWRGWVGIAGGVVAFVVLGKLAGFVAASLACVFVSALGDRTSTLRSAALLSACVTVFGILVFHYLLRIPFPLFWW